MASLEIATKANAALVLSGLLLASHLEKGGLFPSVTKSFSEGRCLINKELIRLTLTEGRVSTDRAVVGYLSELAIDDNIPHRATKVYFLSYSKNLVAAKIFYRFKNGLEGVRSFFEPIFSQYKPRWRSSISPSL